MLHINIIFITCVVIVSFLVIFMYDHASICMRLGQSKVVFGRILVVLRIHA